MKKSIIYLTAILTIGLSSCDYLNQLAEETDGITRDEIAEGLKTALEIGTDTATNKLGIANAYLNNPLIKIPLPPDVAYVKGLIENNSTLNQVASKINLYDKFEDVVVAINHSAESAAKDAKPIFKDAITGMSLTDAWDILNGAVPQSSDALKSATTDAFDSTAATQFFKNHTYTSLVNVYSPKIQTALEQDITPLNFSADDAWKNLTNTYNSFMSNTAVTTALTVAAFSGNAIDLPSELDSDLAVFCTEKALDGLFFRVGKEEKKIRQNPFDWALNIIQKVFGEKHVEPTE